MKIEANSPEEYLDQLPVERKQAMAGLRQTILDNLPKGFEETMSYGMIGYVVPHSIYPNGYHCNPELPLPFISIASQKNYIALYHSCIYADRELLQWFQQEFAKHSTKKLDMGKSCIRFKKVDEIPLDLIAKLTRKVSCKQWIETYESALGR